MEARGYPTKVRIWKPILDDRAAASFWELSESTVGFRY